MPIKPKVTYVGIVTVANNPRLTVDIEHLSDDHLAVYLDDLTPASLSNAMQRMSLNLLNYQARIDSGMGVERKVGVDIHPNYPWRNDPIPTNQPCYNGWEAKDVWHDEFARIPKSLIEFKTTNFIIKECTMSTPKINKFHVTHNLDEFKLCIGFEGCVNHNLALWRNTDASSVSAGLRELADAIDTDKSLHQTFLQKGQPVIAFDAMGVTTNAIFDHYEGDHILLNNTHGLWDKNSVWPRTRENLDAIQTFNLMHSEWQRRKPQRAELVNKLKNMTRK